MSSIAHGGTSDPFPIIGAGCRFPGARGPADWLYEIRWMAKPLTDQARVSEPLRPEQRGNWLIFADAQGVAESLHGLLEAHGERCVLLRRIDDVREFLAEAVGRDQPPWRGIVHLWSLDTATADETTSETLRDAREAGCISVLHLVQALAQAERTDAPRLWLVTRGVQAVAGRAHSVSIAQAPLWGLGKTIALEHPELRCTRIDLGSSAGPDEVRGLFFELWMNDGEDEIALRGGDRYVPRLVEVLPAREERSLIRPDGSYLITGGFGGLGLAVAGWMAEQGARHLVLMGRSGPSSPEAKEALESLKQAGTTVAVGHGDVAREADVIQVLDGIREHLPPLRGIVHAAGVLDDGVLLQQDRERFARVMAPKVEGAWALHTLTANDPLDFFVLFSSGASVPGSPGQGHYMAASAFLDALAHHRRARGLPGLSINWSAWADVGLAARADRVKHLVAQGIRPTMLREPHVQLLAARLRDCLGQVTTEPSGRR